MIVAGLKTSICAAVRSQAFLELGFPGRHSGRFCISDSCRCLTDCSTELIWASTLMRKLKTAVDCVQCLRSCALVKFARIVFSCSTA